MQLFEKVVKTYSDILSEYEEAEPRIVNKGYVNGMKDLLKRRTLKYEVVATELEIMLLTNIDKEKLFKKSYKQLDTILKNTIKDINKGFRWKQKEYKEAIATLVKEQHIRFLTCFKEFEKEGGYY